MFQIHSLFDKIEVPNVPHVDFCRVLKHDQVPWSEWSLVQNVFPVVCPFVQVVNRFLAVDIPSARNCDYFGRFGECLVGDWAVELASRVLVEFELYEFFCAEFFSSHWIFPKFFQIWNDVSV